MQALRSFARRHIGTYRALLWLRMAQWPLRAATRSVVRRLPRSPQLVAFGASNGRFADSPAYLFLHMVADPGAPRCVWVTPSPSTYRRMRALGLPVVRRWSLRGVRVALRAHCYVFNVFRSDINLWLSDGAVAIDLWHGVGIKRIQRERSVGEGADVYAAKDGSLRARIFRDDRHAPDYLVTTSPAMARKFAGAFGMPVDRCVRTGYPRNDHLVSGDAPPAALRDTTLTEVLQGRRPVVGYFPTWRDAAAGLPMPLHVLARMTDVVARQGGVVMFKAHESALTRVDETESLVVLPSDADLNAYLGLCDVVVTDYSSLAYDYLLTGRPVLAFLPDVDDYLAARGFALDPFTYTPGTICRTEQELFHALENLDAVHFDERDGELRGYFNADDRGDACEQIARLVTSVGGERAT